MTRLVLHIRGEKPETFEREEVEHQVDRVVTEIRRALGAAHHATAPSDGIPLELFHEGRPVLFWRTTADTLPAVRKAFGGKKL